MKQEKMKNGFTLVELLVGLVIGAVLVLIVGVISETSVGSHERLRREAEIYNDIFHGFNLIKHSVRNGVNVEVVNGTIIGDMVDKDNSFAVTGNFTLREQNNSDLIFTYTNISTSNTTNNTIIAGVDGLDFDPNQTPELITVKLSGQKDRVNFNLTTEAMRRN